MIINIDKKYAFFLISFLMLISCGSKSSENKVVEAGQSATNNTLKAAAIQDGRCATDQSVTYSFYLPKSFVEGKKYPVLLLFDPHGDGHFALNKYIAAADQFEYILMSSDNIKNGLDRELAAHIMQTLLDAAVSQLPVNTSRVYVGGFSGGARYASMLAMSGSGIQGLLTVGAGFPVDAWKNLSPSVVVAAANDGDMNLPEILALDNIKDKEMRSRTLLIRDKGIHEWISSEKMQEVLSIFTAYAIRDSIENDKKKLDLVISTYQKLDNPDYCAATKIHKSLFYERFVKSLAYLTDINKQIKAYADMIHSQDYMSEKSMELNLVKEEASIKNSYYNSMGTKDTSWWYNEMHQLNTSIQNEKNNLKQAQLMRIRNGLSLMCYMNLDKTMKANSNQDAYYLSVLYRNIDPDNSEAWFLAAVMEARMQNNTKAISYLNIAGQKGFNQRDRVNQTPEFNQLVGDPSFQEAINRLPN